MSNSNPFPVTERLIHLNHAAVGPWPQVTAEAVSRFAQENAEQGSRDYARWLAKEKSLRQQLASLINAASADEIAQVKNTGALFRRLGIRLAVCDSERSRSRARCRRSWPAKAVAMAARTSASVKGLTT